MVLRTDIYSDKKVKNKKTVAEAVPERKMENLKTEV